MAALACGGTLRAAEPPTTVGAFLDRYCAGCHNAEELKGRLDLATLVYDPENRANLAQRVKAHDRVKAGEMPPKEKRRPDEVAHIAALSSTKNEKRERDPEMHQTKKGNQRYFGLKAHIGADRDSKLVHTVVTAANVADVTQTATLLHGAETQVHADAGYTGVEKRSEIVALECRIDWQIATKRGVIKVLAEGAQKDALKTVEKAKAAVRAFVEHPFHLVKNIFGHRKARYRGLLQRKQPPMNSLTESIPVAHGTANDAPAPTANSADARRWRAHEPTSDILNHPTTKGIPRQPTQRRSASNSSGCRHQVSATRVSGFHAAGITRPLAPAKSKWSLSGSVGPCAVCALSLTIRFATTSAARRR